MGQKFLTKKEKEEIFGPSLDTETQIQPEAPKIVEELDEREEVVATATNADAPVCQCGTLMFRAGSCYSCPNCFATTGVCN
jgi:hypothetical protein